MLSDSDRRILRTLQNDPSLSMAELGEAVGMSGQRVNRRVEKLRED
ncbi:MAG: winged helix-turn-helix domain-containing protein, partial [Pseudomonadota bacterium]